MFGWQTQSKIDIGDGQTIRQENVFANHSLYNANLNEVVSVDIKWSNQYFDWSKKPTYKCSFWRALYETVSELSVPVTVIASAKVSHSLSEDEVREYATIWNNTTNWS
jgi:2-succinyl-5-enolpyruvyl-6-hydroxy-3-cyclohexene-1-carboxylate synthase